MVVPESANENALGEEFDEIDVKQVENEDFSEIDTEQFAYYN